ncbi:MAG: hypothetical protein AMJ93_06330 [Anaerolineae bacterium SM23_84]|nr:MAG: hypothetical protein AMJ93_06330 [Anaerolineae bacterium SM23_84]
MIRGVQHVAVAVRKPSGEILVHSEALPSTIYAGPAGKIPFVRGLTSLWDTLVLGVRSLTFSADVALEEEGVEFGGPMMWGTLLFSLLLGIGLFVILPALLVGMMDRYITMPLLGNLAEGLVRLLFYMVYLVVIGRLPDIRRVFAYHGAEHKTVNAYEAGVALTPQDVGSFATAHTRCGTSLLLIVLFVFVLLSSMMGRPPLLWRLLSRLVLLPVVAALSYEFLRFTARNDNRAWVRVLMAPGLWLQRLTTQEPDDSMLEVSIAALRRVLQEDGSASE